jgi:hypothetical protein
MTFANTIRRKRQLLVRNGSSLMSTCIASAHCDIASCVGSGFELLEKSLLSACAQYDPNLL